MVHLFTTDVEKFLDSLKLLVATRGNWSVAASVYSRPAPGFAVRAGVRAAAWLPMGRELLILDTSSEVMPGSVDAQAAERDLNAVVARVEAASKKLDVKFLPMLLDWIPEGRKGGAV